MVQSRAGERLALDAPLVLAGLRGVDRGVELIGLRPRAGRRPHRPRRAARPGRRCRRAAAAAPTEPPGGTAVEAIVERGLGAGLRRVDAVLAVDDVAVEGVLDERRAAVTCRGRRRAAQFVSLSVKSERRRRRAVERARAQPVVNRDVAEGFHGRVVGDQAQRVRRRRGPGGCSAPGRASAPRPRCCGTRGAAGCAAARPRARD